MREKIATFTGSTKVDQCSLFREKALYLKPEQEDFPGGPVAKTPHSQRRAPGLNPWSED